MIKVLPKINLNSVKVGVDYLYIQLQDTSLLEIEEYNLDREWSTSNGAVIVSNSESVYTTLIIPTTITELEIKLELLLNDINKTATKTIVLKYDGTNLSYFENDLEFNFYQDNLGINFFKPNFVEKNIIGVPFSETSTLYEFDNINNGTIDDSSTLTKVFSNNYIPNKYEASTFITFTNSTYKLETTVVFSYRVDYDRGVNVFSEECKHIKVQSYDYEYLSKVIGSVGIDNSKMNSLDVKVSVNCCEIKTFKIAPDYDLNLINDICTPTGNIVNIDGNDYTELLTTVKVLGIDTSVIENIAYTTNPLTQSINTVSIGTDLTTMEDILIYFPIGAGPGYRGNYKVTITNKDGFVYTIVYTLKAGVDCDNDLDDIVVTKPELPEYISFEERYSSLLDNYTGTNMIIDPEFFGYDYLPHGVYQVEIKDESVDNTWRGGCTFVDCNLHCLISEALSKDCDFDIYFTYQSLLASLNCKDVVSCQALCNIYEYLMNMLNACDCSYSNIEIIPKQNDCGCS